jgi:circadian clock protein KaiC
VSGLDAILGGGLPEHSFNLISGPPGSGKTTLAHQLMFAMASPERPALFFTVLGEPPGKMRRHQEPFAFFDADKLDKAVRFVDLSDDMENGHFNQVLERIKAEIAASSPGLVFVDSFHSVMLEAQDQLPTRISAQQFTQQLGIFLSRLLATTFLLGAYDPQTDLQPVYTIADGIMTLRETAFRNSTVRKIQVTKMRGQATSPGIHTFRITNEGLKVFPSVVLPNEGPSSGLIARSDARVTMGVPELDAMLGGGLPAGYSLLVAGPSGSGKTVLATAFLVDGVRRGETGVIVAFEQTPSQTWTRTIDELVSSGKIALINTRSLDLSIDEIVQKLIALIKETKATRVVIDSLSGFELAVAPTFREDFRESLFRMVSVLASLGVTVLMTSELEDRYTDLRFSPYGSAFLTDAIIVQRYVEVNSALTRVMAVIKVRGSAHSRDLRQYDITNEGIVIGDRVLDYEGILGGRPRSTQTP